MSEIRTIVIDVCPVWREEDGSLLVGMDFRQDPPDAQSWCIIQTVELGGERYKLLLNLEALEPDEDDDTLETW